MIQNMDNLMIGNLEKILNEITVLKNIFSAYIRPVVVNMRWVNVFVQDFAISCI